MYLPLRDFIVTLFPLLTPVVITTASLEIIRPQTSQMSTVNNDENPKHKACIFRVLKFQKKKRSPED